jgi:photosystem II stability/assembly factor-like uncharacterized protein
MQKLAFLLFISAIFIAAVSEAQWVKSHGFPGNRLYDIEFDRSSPLPQAGWMLSLQDSVFRTIDGGKTWNRSNANISGTAFAFKFLKSGSNYVGLMVGSSGQAWRSFDNGATWMLTSSTGVTGSLLGIDYLLNLGQHAWAVGTQEKIIYSGNVGGLWNTQNTGNNTLNSVGFVDKDKGWVVGSGGKILRTVNGSATTVAWSAQGSLTATNLNDVYFISSTTGWVAGDAGQILFTNSSGEPWRIQNTGVSDNLFGISFADETNGVTVGQNSKILHTKNGGNTWQAETSPVTDTFFKVFYFNLENCWIIGSESGNLLYSQGSVTITAPNGGEELEGGKMQTIRWESNYLSQVRIEFSTDNGVNWNPISSATAAPNGSLNWTPPTNINSSSCKIRIAGVTKPSVQDESNQVFTIFKPDDTPPPMQVLPSSLTGKQGKDVPIAAIITDASGIKEAKLYHRLAGKSSFNPAVGMTPTTNDTFKAKIPWPAGQDEGLQGFEFYLEAFDASFKMNRTASPVQFVSIQVVSYSQPITASTPERPRYQMISVPLEFLGNDGSIDSLLVDDFGPYDLKKPTNWRLFRWLSRDKKNGEFLVDPVGQFEPGKAFWLVSRKAGFDVTTGESVRLQDFQITLEPSLTNDPLSGWNQIGHPFAFPVTWQSIMAASGNPQGIAKPSRRDPEKDTYEIVDVLLPWNGYFVKNPSSNPITLTISAKESSAGPAKVEHHALGSKTTGTEWALQLLVDCQEFRDDVNFLGIHTSSKNDWDVQDQPEPPVIGEYVSLYFPHRDWEKYPDHYTTDFRSPFQDGQVWDFVVATNVPNVKAEIIFNGVKSIPSDFDIYLVDDKLAISQNLRQNPGYSFPTGSATLKKMLRLVVGKPDFFQRHNLQINQVPGDYELAQNFPNPFNPATAIRFGLPVAPQGGVTLKIFNVLGEEIAVLLDNEQKPAGYHVQIWNGLDKRGHASPSGVYFYRITAGKFTATRKMLFVK